MEKKGGGTGGVCEGGVRRLEIGAKTGMWYVCAREERWRNKSLKFFFFCLCPGGERVRSTGGSFVSRYMQQEAVR